MKAHAPQQQSQPQQVKPRYHSLLNRLPAVSHAAPVSSTDGLEVAGGPAAATRFAHDFSRVPTTSGAPISLQAKLTVNTPGDPYEQEADRVSERVLRAPEPRLQRACACGGTCAGCQTKQPGRQRETLRMKRARPGDAGRISAPPAVHEVLRSPGRPLDAAARAFMEPRFGQDFGGVRIHADAKAAESARAVGALAYTVGRDVVFGAGQYAPDTERGRRLLAHELTHVVQQDGGRAGGGGEAHSLQRFTFPDMSMGDVLEGVAGIAGGPGLALYVRANRQFLGDLKASVKESPEHFVEFFKDELLETIKENWITILLVTTAILTVEAAVAVLTAIPEPTLLTKVVAAILQILLLAVVGYFAAVELKGVYDEGQKWFSEAHEAHGRPEHITSASRAFVRMVWHILMAILAIAGVRLKVRQIKATTGGTKTLPPGNTSAPKLTSGEIGGKIIGWGTGQSVEAVQQTQQVTRALTTVKVQQMISQGLTRAWVEEQLGFYTGAVAKGGAKLNNTQLFARKELMERILSLWP